ncbi:putative Zinc finger protein 143 [Hypsibius exemplaris]|uniref:Zinc finger protein 143 n=1 Tax=Hypsibius exemplaris TaxID=2072580 RepID=A0A9X6RP28_HYPEX|nr:putative Zinc finger protein 143 [Hypsibius exemplaris]
MEATSKETIVCGAVGCTFSTTWLWSFKTHYNRKHRANQTKIKYPAPDCSFSTSDNCGLTRHLKEVHRGCSRKCFSSGQLATHSATYSGEKVLCCTFNGCDKRFTTLRNLASHMSCHLKRKSFKCSFDGCDFTYHKRSTVTYHERTHRGLRPYACPYAGCNFSASNHSNLQSHAWIHAGAKPHACLVPNCDRKFRSTSKRKKHMDVVHRGQWRNNSVDSMKHCSLTNNCTIYWITESGILCHRKDLKESVERDKTMSSSTFSSRAAWPLQFVNRHCQDGELPDFDGKAQQDCFVRFQDFPRVESMCLPRELLSPVNS